MTSVRERLDAIIDEFSDLDSREKLELLVDFANGLPPLPPGYEARKATEDRRVHECQTPVFLWMESAEGTANLVAEVAPEAPTVKGFVAILAEAINGRPVAEVGSISDDMLERMGLADVLGILRSRGLRSIVARVKRGFKEADAA
ncbi:MAG: SufE family protein [Planctomycetia bacterium]